MSAAGPSEERTHRGPSVGGRWTDRQPAGTQSGKEAGCLQQGHCQAQGRHWENLEITPVLNKGIVHCHSQILER